MRFSEYKGLGLVLATAVAAIWLALTGQLNLYIHPRYIVFTVVFAALAILISIFGIKYDHPPDDIAAESKRRGRWGNITGMAAAAVCIFGVTALLMSKPVPLTSATANQRGVNSAVAASTMEQPVFSPLFANNDYSGFNIKDWTSLMAQTDDAEFFIGKNASVLGFVVADQNDRDIFYVTRFLISCCAVDGRAIGLAVHSPGWRDRFKENDWVQVRGTFMTNPSLANQELAVIKPESIQKTNQPEQVYAY